MPSLSIIEDFKIFKNPPLSLSFGLEYLQLNQFALEGAEEGSAGRPT
jgi:hypothetical protein